MAASRLIENTLTTGAIATVATTASLAFCGTLEGDSAVAPINAVSHIPWGDEAARREDLSWKFTATGFALNAAAVTSWAAIHEWLAGEAADRGDVAGVMLGGAAVSGLAYVVDYHVVPPRLTPGFEKRLSGKSMIGVYSVLALGLALGSLLRGLARRT